VKTFPSFNIPVLKAVSRILWVALVSGIVIQWSANHGNEIRSLLSSIGPLHVFLVILVTLLGKLVVSEQGRIASNLVGYSFGTRYMFWMYSSSDIAKYVPGGIWNALARVKLYRDAGMSTQESTRAFTLEKFWQVTGAFFVGLILLLAELVDRLSFLPDSSLVLASLYVAVTVCWVAITLAGNYFIGTEGDLPRAVFRAFFDQIIIAFFLGLGLWIPLDLFTSVDLLTAVGAFSLGRAAGYVAIFAPAGVGVRELVSLWALGGASANSFVVALGINRLLTTVTDFLGFGIATLWCRPKPHLGAQRTGEQNDL